MLNTPEYAWREMRLGGAPMERERWLSLHEGHETYTGVLPAKPLDLEFVACWRCGTLALGKLPEVAAPAAEPVVEAPPPPDKESLLARAKKGLRSA